MEQVGQFGIDTSGNDGPRASGLPAPATPAERVNRLVPCDMDDPAQADQLLESFFPQGDTNLLDHIGEVESIGYPLSSGYPPDQPLEAG